MNHDQCHSFDFEQKEARITGKYFSTDPGQFEVVSWYADNEMYRVEITFSVSGDEWIEFQKSQLFRDLKAYVRAHNQQIQDMSKQRHDRKCTTENKVNFYSAVFRICKKIMDFIETRRFQ